MTALPEHNTTFLAGRPGLLLALALATIAPVVAWAAHAWLGLYLEPGRWRGWTNNAASGLGMVWFWAWVLALAPVFEELAMRPLLQTGLQHQLERIHNDRLCGSRDWRGHLANAGTALVFAALHMPVNGALALWWLIPAAAIGEVWRRSARWSLCALLHAWFNACLAAATLVGSLQ